MRKEISSAPDKSEPADTAGRMRAEIRALMVRDNRTNWLYIGRVWFFIALAIAGASWAHGMIAAHGLGWAWHVPVAMTAVFVIGASQHQLGGVLHEAAHYMLFADRKLNERVGDWLAGFPLYTSVYHYRTDHLAHHQFIKDPERDPEIAQLRYGGQWLDYPVTHIDVMVMLLKQLWLPNLLRYTLGRALSLLSDKKNPYVDPQRTGSRWPLILTVFFWIGVPLIVQPLSWSHFWLLAFVAIAAVWAASVTYFLFAPERAFPGGRIDPVIGHRDNAIMRMTFLALVYGALTAINVLRGDDWGWRTFALYWVVPLFTTFPLFLILRQWVQHGNADRGRYTNSRVFLVGPIIRYAVFPFGQDYHLPHHLYASVPHYNLKTLHEVLLKDPEYREKGVVVEGYFGRDNPVSGRPTAISVLGAAHAPKNRERIYIDNAALDFADVNDPTGIALHAEQSQQRG